MEKNYRPENSPNSAAGSQSVESANGFSYASGNNDWEHTRRMEKCPCPCGVTFECTSIGVRQLGTGQTDIPPGWLPGHNHVVILYAVRALGEAFVANIQKWISEHTNGPNPDLRWGGGSAYHKVQRPISTLVGAGYLNMQKAPEGSAWLYSATQKGEDYLDLLEGKIPDVAPAPKVEENAQEAKPNPAKPVWKTVWEGSRFRDSKEMKER